MPETNLLILKKEIGAINNLSLHCIRSVRLAYELEILLHSHCLMTKKCISAVKSLREYPGKSHRSLLFKEHSTALISILKSLLQLA